MADITYSEIERHIDALDLKAFAPGGKNHFTPADIASSPGQVLSKVCAIYRAVRPILLVLENFPLIPQKFRDALKTFTDLMDKLCPGQ